MNNPRDRQGGSRRNPEGLPSPEMLEAYDTFGRAAETGALKVVISRKG